MGREGAKVQIFGVTNEIITRRSTFYQTPPSLWNLDLKHIDFCWLTCCALYFRFSFLIPIQLAPEIFLLPFTAIVLQLLECLFLSYLILNAKYLV